MIKILTANVQQKDEKNVTISLSSGLLDDKSKGDDDFHSQELIISMASALDFDETHKDLDPAQKLKSKLEIFSEMNIDEKDKGFFTKTYVPFLKKMVADSLLETACYLIYSSTNDSKINQWLQQNESKINVLKTWLQQYQWVRE